MRKYRVKKPLHFLSKMPNGKYEVMTNKDRWYENTVISFIWG